MKIYHHNDHDGRCAAAIVLRYAMEGPVGFQSIETIEVDYADILSFDTIKPNEDIVIVDFSFTPEDMNKVLLKTESIVWLDHHKTAFDFEKNYAKVVRGFRSINDSGCELAWMFYCKDKPMPLAVQLIGDRDKWAWKMGEQTGPFNEGLKLYDVSPKSNIWDKLFDEKVGKGWVDIIAKEGKTCLQYRDMICKDYANNFGFETEFMGYKAFAIGIYAFGSSTFGEKINEYPLCLTFEFNGKVWTVGLYSDKKDLHVGELVVSYMNKHKNVITRAGGHKGAAGFTSLIVPEILIRQFFCS